MKKLHRSFMAVVITSVLLMCSSVMAMPMLHQDGKVNAAAFTPSLDITVTREVAELKDVELVTSDMVRTFGSASNHSRTALEPSMLSHMESVVNSNSDEDPFAFNRNLNKRQKNNLPTDQKLNLLAVNMVTNIRLFQSSC